MVEKLSEDDYATLDGYIQAVLRRVRDEESSLPDAREVIMHPLTAWEHGNKQEFVPYMKLMMDKWQRGEDRLEREQRKEQSVEALVEDVMEIGRHCAALPVLDRRRPDDILGYDENGRPR